MLGRGNGHLRDQSDRFRTTRLVPRFAFLSAANGIRGSGRGGALWTGQGSNLAFAACGYTTVQVVITPVIRPLHIYAKLLAPAAPPALEERRAGHFKMRATAAFRALVA